MTNVLRAMSCVLRSSALALAIASTLLMQGGSANAGNLRNGPDVRRAFQSVTSAADAATVRIQCAGKDAALGTVVGSDGWILTKYSELREPITCKLADQKQFTASVVGYDPQYDLAMLKIDTTDLKTIDWSGEEKGPAVGQLLATASPGELPLAIGVVSVPLRKIPSHLARPRAKLGIQVGEDDKPTVADVISGGPAEKAGLKIGDVVLQANGEEKSRNDFLEFIRQSNPGDHVELLIKRNDEELKISATLKRPDDVGPVSRSDWMNEMGGPLSHRSSGFPSVIQHDTVLRPTDCGGPLVDLSGKAVGINIARAGRTESYAAPADKVRGLIADLESGRMAPKDALPGAKETKNTSTGKPDGKPAGASM